MNQCVLLLFFIISHANIFSKNDIFDLSPIEKGTPEQIEKRFETIRRGTIEIYALSDSEGNIEQLRHEFFFGTAIPNELASMSENSLWKSNSEKHLEILGNNFHYVVLETSLNRNYLSTSS